MLRSETISAILDEFSGEPVSAQAEHCLNARHKDASCRQCTDVCPTDAIEVQSGRPHLDPDRCVSCGLCLYGCPTDVFTQRSTPEARLAQTVSKLRDDALALACPRHAGPENTTIPVSTVV